MVDLPMLLLMTLLRLAYTLFEIDTADLPAVLLAPRPFLCDFIFAEVGPVITEPLMSLHERI